MKTEKEIIEDVIRYCESRQVESEVENGYYQNIIDVLNANN